MARKAEGTGKVRADLEAATLALVDIEEVMPMVRLRIKQAIIHAGLSALLDPALDDLLRMAIALQEAKSQVKAATRKLLEK